MEENYIEENYMDNDLYARMTIRLYGVTWSELVHATGVIESELDTNAFFADRWSEIPDEPDAWIFDYDTEGDRFPYNNYYGSFDRVKTLLMSLVKDIRGARCEGYYFSCFYDLGYEKVMFSSYRDNELCFFEVDDCCDLFDCEKCESFIRTSDTRIADSFESLICPECNEEISAEHMAADSDVIIHGFELSGSEWILKKRLVFNARY